MKFTHLKNDYEFRRAYNKGKSFVSPLLVTYCFKRKRGGISVGITTGKKIGSAVSRNRCRRIIREAYRSLSNEVSGNWDIVFVARVRTALVKTQDVEKDMRRHLVKSGVMKSDENKAAQSEDVCKNTVV